jgi:Fic family protein
MNGNDRVGRFLMNTMMASGGYPQTIIPVSARSAFRLTSVQRQP